MQTTYINKINIFHNLHYCFTYGYNLNHPSKTSSVANSSYHIPNILRDEAHVYANQGESMVAQYTSLTYGKGAVMVFIIANRIRKAQFVMQNQQGFLRIHQHQQPYYP